MMQLPATPADLIREVLDPASEYLPARMNSIEARVALIAIALQESELKVRRQYGNGPARGLWQFERGTSQSRGGVWGIYLHENSRGYLQTLCAALDCPFDPTSIWSRLETDDLLAACCARLLLYTDPRPLPAPKETAVCWNLYALRTWRPGKPHPEKWPANHAAARRALGLL
jgi:hypothetical protein